MKCNTLDSPNLDVSILIATRNRSRLMQQTLDSLLVQELNGLSWEVIVIDNGSTDDTTQVLRKMQNRLPLRILRENAPGKNRALNRGLSIARGSLYIFTDNDVIADRNWVRELHNASRRWPEATIFGGRTDPLFPDDSPQWALKRRGLLEMAFGWCVHDQNEGITSSLPFGANMAIRAQLFEDLHYLESIGPSGLAYPMGSETELLLRLKKRGERIVYVPSAKVQHVIEQHQLHRKWLYQRAFRAGWGLAEVSEPPHRFRHICGIPFWVLKRVATASASSVSAVFRDIEPRVHSRLHYWHARGLFYGYYRRARDKRRRHK